MSDPLGGIFLTHNVGVCHIWTGKNKMAAGRSTDKTDGDGRRLTARLCHLHFWTDFPGYGFNLFARKGRPGHYVQNIEHGSPAEAGGLRVGDRIVEVNGLNVFNENHQQVTAQHYHSSHLCRLVSVLDIGPVNPGQVRSGQVKSGRCRSRTTQVQSDLEAIQLNLTSTLLVNIAEKRFRLL